MGIRPRKKLFSRYRFEQGQACIEIRVHNSRQLFDDRDPAPFREKDLDDDLVSYIVTSFEEVSPHNSRLVIYIADSEESSVPRQSIVNAIHSFFEFEAWLTGRQLNQLFKQGQKSLLIGLSCLLLFISLSHWIGEHSNDFFSSMLEEGVAIMGWVAMWKPIDIILYSWWPIVGRRKNYQQLSTIDVEVHYEA